MKSLSRNEYGALVSEIISEIGKAKVSAGRSVNRELVALYWNIGKLILEKQQLQGWGKAVVEKLAADLRKKLPAHSGFSARNLWDMRRFYAAYHDHPKLRQLVAEIPWGHILLLLNKVADVEACRYYYETTIQMGWSRKVLLNQIKANAYKRHRLLPKHHNFKKTLPSHLLSQADEMLKSHYNLDFLGITQPIHERQLENRLIERLKHFILELGYWFSFIGNQYHIAIGRKEYAVDLLFFHRMLRCLVAVDLKIGSFEPEFTGKMNFYLNLLDDRVRMEGENPSIGIILCADKNSVEVEYALKGIDKPIAVAEYRLQKAISKKLQKQLPTAKELQDLIREELKWDRKRMIGH